MGRNSLFLIAATVLVIISFVILFWTGSDMYHNNARCRVYRNFLQDSFSETMINKYNDPHNHMKPTIAFNEKEICVSLDISGFYDFVMTGDSLVKVKEDSNIIIFRNGEFLKSFTLDFGCIEETK